MRGIILRSPGYPSRYPRNIYCVYRVHIPFNQELIVYFQFFELEFERNCRYTELQLVCSELLLHESFHSATYCLPLLLLIQVLFLFRFFPGQIWLFKDHWWSKQHDWHVLRRSNWSKGTGCRYRCCFDVSLIFGCTISWIWANLLLFSTWVSYRVHFLKSVYILYIMRNKSTIYLTGHCHYYLVSYNTTGVLHSSDEMTECGVPLACCL